MRRRHRWSWHWLGHACAVIALASVSGAPFEARAAAPIEATGTATVQAQDPGRAREQAITAARRAALEQAIAGLDVAVDAEAVAQVLARPDAWTAGYRVLEIRSSDAGVEVRIEAEIDLPRLRKRVAQGAGANTPARAGFRWDALTANGCPGLADAALITPLTAYGIVTADGASTLTVAVSCSDRGAVSHTHVRAATVELVAQTRGELSVEVRTHAQGFAEDLGAATQIALDRAVAELADELSVAARGDLELRVEQPWPAARVTALTQALRDTVLGVDAVELAGIRADGSVVLRIGGSLDAQALARALQAASFPGFGLVGSRVDGARAVRVRMQ